MKLGCCRLLVEQEILVPEGWYECSQVMQEHKIHHLPVADEQDNLVGLISATDIFMAVEEAGWEEEGAGA